MHFGLGRNARTMAHVAFYGLVALTFGLLVALSGFASYFTPVYETCRSVWDNLLLWVSSLSVVIPAGLVASAVAVAGLTLIRQWRATRGLLAVLAAYQVPVPTRLARLAKDVGLEDRIDCVADVVIGPFCYGFVQPRVCVPRALLDVLDDSELRAVLRHEGYHARSRDPLKIWLSRALARGLYFVPLAGDLRDSYLAAKEVAADEVIDRSDELPLASALVKMLSASESRSGSAPAMASSTVEFSSSAAEATTAALDGVPVAGLITVTRVSHSETEERVRRLLDSQPAQIRLPSIMSVLLSIVIVLAIFTFSYTGLSAASVVPVSQECAAENMLRRPEPALRHTTRGMHSAELAEDLTAVGLETDGAAVSRERVRADATLGPSDCDLLTPSCAAAGALLSPSTFGPSTVGTIH